MFEKSKKNLRPVRALFWILAFLLLLSFVIVLPIYKNANMSASEHMHHGLLALQEEKYTKAKTHLLRAAQSQNAKAFFILASMELEGKNEKAKANPKEAAFYLENAANLGLKDAQYTLALLYDRGEGVAQDKQRALNWALLAAAQGDLKALYSCAVWLERGYSGKPELYQAVNLYEYAAAQGHQNAMATLISIYSGGTEIPANKERAEYWKKQLQTQKNLKQTQKNRILK